jgi:hypothetical protein
VHDEAPADEYFPAGHVWHVRDELAPIAAENVPAAQLVHVCVTLEQY